MYGNKGKRKGNSDVCCQNKEKLVKKHEVPCLKKINSELDHLIKEQPQDSTEVEKAYIPKTEYKIETMYRIYGSTQVQFTIHSYGNMMTVIITEVKSQEPIMIGDELVGYFSPSKTFKLYIAIPIKDNIGNHLDSLYNFCVTGKYDGLMMVRLTNV
jgi:hypothetical protein